MLQLRDFVAQERKLAERMIAHLWPRAEDPAARAKVLQLAIWLGLVRLEYG